MQFKVPQNIDLEDKIVGPLTLVQFLYVLGGGLIDYILFQSIAPKSMAVFLILAIPIALIAAGMAFVKIQDQPLSHFIKAGIYYYTHPKARFWKKVGVTESVLVAPPKTVVKEGFVPHKKIVKSDLEKLANVLDTGPLNVNERQNFGRVTTGYEQIIQQGLSQQNNRQVNQTNQPPRPTR